MIHPFKGKKPEIDDSSLVVESQRGELILLRSRGANSTQILVVFPKVKILLNVLKEQFLVTQLVILEGLLVLIK